MKLNITKNKILEFNFTGKPDDKLWNNLWNVRLGRRFFMGKRFSFYYMVWNKKRSLTQTEIF